MFTSFCMKLVALSFSWTKFNTSGNLPYVFLFFVSSPAKKTDMRLCERVALTVGTKTF